MFVFLMGFKLFYRVKCLSYLNLINIDWGELVKDIKAPFKLDGVVRVDKVVSN